MHHGVSKLVSKYKTKQQSKLRFIRPIVNSYKEDIMDSSSFIT